MSDIGNKDIMAENLKYYIERSGKDRRELAEAWGFPYSTVSDWINAKKYPRIDRIEIMAEYFGIAKSDLIEKRADAPRSREDANANFRLNVGEAKLVTLFREVPEADRDMVVKMIESALSARRVEKATDEIAANIARTAASVQRPRTFGMVRGRAGQRPAARGMQAAKERSEKQEAIYAAMRKVKK